MQLKSFGCSFIYGSDLSNKNTSWPGLIAKHKGYDYLCHARPGSGNLQILEQILKNLPDSSDALFVIGWTWIDRFDYTTKDDQWKTILPADQDNLAKSYYRDLHSQFRDKLTSLIAIDTAISVLRSKSIPFVMTYIDDLLFEAKWHITPAIIELQDRVRPYLMQFQGKNFVDWSKSHSFTVSDTLHPLEDAHIAASELVLNNWEQYIKTN